MTTTTRPNRSPAARPSVEPLEGRQLMSATSLDTTFGGGDGVWTHDVGNSTAEAIAVTPEGNTFVAQTVQNTYSWTDLSVRQLNPDGTPFTKFTTVGAQNAFPLPGQQKVVDLAVQKDGRPIVLAVDYPNSRLAVIRFMWNGAIDNTFGGKGILYLKPTAIPGQRVDPNLHGGSLALGGDGRIFVTGRTEYFDADPEGFKGGLATFALDASGYPLAWGPTVGGARPGYHVQEFGVRTSEVSVDMDTAVTPDGRLVTVGTWGKKGFAVRYNPAGEPDNTFGIKKADGTRSGFQWLGLAGEQELTGLALQPDGKLLVAGVQRLPDNVAFATLARVTADGNGWDASFGGSGWGGVRKFRPAYSTAAGFRDVALQADGKIVAVAESQGRTHIVRYKADGTDDATLTGTANYADVFTGTVRHDVRDLAIAPGGQYLLAGTVGAGDAARAGVARLDGQPAAPAAPKNLFVSSKTATSLTLKWTDTSSFNTGFEVTYSKAPITVFNPGTVVPVNNGNATTATLNNLSPDTTYYVRVRAVNKTASGLVAKSPWSSEWSTKTAAAIAAPAPVVATKLAGTVIGTAGSYGSFGNTRDNAFDGNVNTYFDGPAPTGNWVGLDLGAAKSVKQVKYAPRAGNEARMVGGKFQASNTADFSAGVVDLLTVTAPPPAGVLTTAAVNVAGTFRYVRYVAPANSFGNVAEVEFWG